MSVGATYHLLKLAREDELPALLLDLRHELRLLLRRFQREQTSPYSGLLDALS